MNRMPALVALVSSRGLRVPQRRRTAVAPNPASAPRGVILPPVSSHWSSCPLWSSVGTVSRAPCGSSWAEPLETSRSDRTTPALQAARAPAERCTARRLDHPGHRRRLDRRGSWPRPSLVTDSVAVSRVGLRRLQQPLRQRASVECDEVRPEAD
jgi:hypothetical protein